MIDFLGLGFVFVFCCFCFSFLPNGWDNTFLIFLNPFKFPASFSGSFISPSLLSPSNAPLTIKHPSTVQGLEKSQIPKSTENHSHVPSQLEDLGHFRPRVQETCQLTPTSQGASWNLLWGSTPPSITQKIHLLLHLLLTNLRPVLYGVSTKVI